MSSILCRKGSRSLTGQATSNSLAKSTPAKPLRKAADSPVTKPREGNPSTIFKPPAKSPQQCRSPTKKKLLTWRQTNSHQQLLHPQTDLGKRRNPQTEIGCVSPPESHFWQLIAHGETIRSVESQTPSRQEEHNKIWQQLAVLRPNLQALHISPVPQWLLFLFKGGGCDSPQIPDGQSPLVVSPS